MVSGRRFGMSVVLSAFLTLWGSIGWAADAPVQAGFSATTLSAVDIQDAQVALKVWFEQILTAEGLDYHFENPVFRTAEELDHVVKSDGFDVLTLSAVEFIRLSQYGKFEYPLASEISGKLLDRLVLLVHNDSKVSNLADLKGKKLLIDIRLAGENPEMWLEVELAKAGLPPGRAHFQVIKKVKEKPSQAILPVFFKQTDVCIVREESYEAVVEMNPQVKKFTRVLMTSQPLIRGVTVFRKGFDPTKRDNVIKSSKKLHLNPKGKQVLTLFKVDNIIELKTEDLASIQALYRQYQELSKAKN